MERDFMGLVVKEESSEEAIDAAPLRSSTMQWPFSNKTSALPQLLSFQAVQEDKPKTGFHSLASAGLVMITTTETFGVMQENTSPENQGVVHYAVTTYPSKHLDAHAIHHPITSQTNPTTSSAMDSAIRQSHVASAGQNPITPISPQPISAVPMANPVRAMPSSSPVVGTTDLRSAPKISGVPAQLTIFYNGSVCVYDNVSPEKAQSIMLLAGNGHPSTCSAPILAAPVQTSMPRPSILESFAVNHPHGTTPRRSSPTVIATHSVTQSVGWSGNINDTTASRQGSVLVSSNKVGPQKVLNSPGSVSATFLPLSTDTVPQFRRKSLARFLEKRKERVINMTPYANKQSPDCSSSGLCPAPAVT